MLGQKLIWQLNPESKGLTIEALNLPEGVSIGETYYLPTGISGPYAIPSSNKPLFAPLATTEGALVASYQRGAKVLSNQNVNWEIKQKESDIWFLRVNVLIPEKVVVSVLKSSSVQLYNYWVSSCMGILQSASKGANGHFANGLSAFFLATGLSLEHLPKCSEGITELKQAGNGLYAEITLPNLCLNFENCPKNNSQISARLVAQISEQEPETGLRLIGSMLLGGELSIMAAISSGHFAKAHKKLGRKK